MGSSSGLHMISGRVTVAPSCFHLMPGALRSASNSYPPPRPHEGTFPSCTSMKSFGPQMVGLLIQGHPQRGPPIYRNSQRFLEVLLTHGSLLRRRQTRRSRLELAEVHLERRGSRLAQPTAGLALVMQGSRCTRPVLKGG